MAVPINGGAPTVNATREQVGAAALSALIVGTKNGILYVEAEVRLGSSLRCDTYKSNDSRCLSCFVLLCCVVHVHCQASITINNRQPC